MNEEELKEIIKNKLTVKSSTISGEYIYFRINNIVDEYTITTFQEIANKHNSSLVYHNFDHVLNILVNFYKSGLQVSDQFERLFVLTTLFHDIIYIPGEMDNEIQSANCFSEHFSSSLSGTDVFIIKNLIIFTQYKFNAKEYLDKHFPEIDDNLDLELLFELFQLYDFGHLLDSTCSISEIIDIEEKIYSEFFNGIPEMTKEQFVAGRYDILLRLYKYCKNSRLHKIHDNILSFKFILSYYKLLYDKQVINKIN